MPKLREIVRELRDHSEQVRRWAMLMTQSYEKAGPENDYKELLSVISAVTGLNADKWMDEITSYHANRARNVFDVR